MKKFAVHGTAKGKTLFDQAPIAHVWANDAPDAERQGELITRMNPIYNEHFENNVNVKETPQ